MCYILQGNPLNIHSFGFLAMCAICATSYQIYYRSHTQYKKQGLEERNAQRLACKTSTNSTYSKDGVEVQRLGV